MNPFKIGDVVRFTPSAGFAGYRGKVVEGGIAEGFEGEISSIRDKVYLFFEEDRGGVHYSEFTLVRRGSVGTQMEGLIQENPYHAGDEVRFMPKHIALNADSRFFPFGMKRGAIVKVEAVENHLVWIEGLRGAIPWWFFETVGPDLKGQHHDS